MAAREVAAAAATARGKADERVAERKLTVMVVRAKAAEGVGQQRKVQARAEARALVMAEAGLEGVAMAAAAPEAAVKAAAAPGAAAAAWAVAAMATVA